MLTTLTEFPKEESHFLIQGPAGQLEVKACHPKSTRRKVTVIICHPHPLHAGTMDNKVVTTAFRSFRELGADVVRFNYRGVGQSQGNYGDAIGESEDLRAVSQWAQNLLVNNQLWLVGFSFGSYVAARMADSLQATRLLSIAPAVSRFDFKPLQVQCPWLVIQGDADEVVPPQQVYDWLANHHPQPQLKIIPDCSHFFHGQLTTLKQIIFAEYGDDHTP